jgi:hypothetical protein
MSKQATAASHGSAALFLAVICVICAAVQQLWGAA